MRHPCSRWTGGVIDWAGMVGKIGEMAPGSQRGAMGCGFDGVGGDMGWLGCGWGQSAACARNVLACSQVITEEAAVPCSGKKRAPQVPLAAQAFALLTAACDFGVWIEGVEDIFRRRTIDFDRQLPVLPAWCLLVAQLSGIDRVLGPQ